MISQAILVDECTFKESSGVVGDYDYEFIIPYIRIAQDLDLSEHTGEALLNRIYAGIIADDLNSDERTLINNYIAPTVIHYALFRGMDNLAVKVSNSGLERRDSENGTAIDLNESSYLGDKEKTIADSYGQRLKDYLVNNTDLYPQYKTEMEGQITPSTDPSFNGGLYIGINNKNCNTL